MIHKRAYYRGLIKVADVLPVSMPQYVQVGNGTRISAPIDSVKVGDEQLTYKHLGFTDRGNFSPNYNPYDHTKEGSPPAPASLLQFLTNKDLAGKLHIDREHLRQAMKTHMPRIRGGNVPLTQQRVSMADLEAALNYAYKLQHPGTNYHSDSGFVNDLTHWYGTYRADVANYKLPAALQPAAAPTAQSNNPPAPVPIPKKRPVEAKKPTETVKKPTADPNATNPTTTTTTAYAPHDDFPLTPRDIAVINAHYALKQDANKSIYEAYVKGNRYAPVEYKNRSGVGTYTVNKPVGDFFASFGIEGDGSWYSDWANQRQYQARKKQLAFYLGFIDSNGTWINGGQPAFQQWMLRRYEKMRSK